MYLQCNALRLTVLAAAVAMAVSAQAQETPKSPATAQAPVQKEGDGKLQRVEVVGSAQAYDPRRDDTATKIVVNHDEIVKYGDTTVLDVLKRVPGVTIGGGAGRGGEIRMRGLGSGYTQILINGERAPAGFSIDSLAPDVIERIEVLRAATAEFSTQSVAGTINIVLKKAIATAQRELKAGVAHGHGYTSPGANLQLSDRAGKLSWSLPINVGFAHIERQSPSVEQGYDLNGRTVMLRTTASGTATHFGALNVAPRLNWNLEGGDTLTWQTFINANRVTNDSNTITTTSVGSAPTYPELGMAMTNRNEFFRSDLNWVHKLASGSRLDLKIGGLLGGLENSQHRTGFANGRQVLDSVTGSKGTDHGVSSTGKYTNPLVAGHTLALGWDVGYNTRDDARVQNDAAIGGSSAYFLDERFKGRVVRTAVYAQDEWVVTPRWSVYFGTRWEGIQTRTSGNTFDTANSRSSVFSPLLQTLFKLPGAKADQLRFAVTRTYKAPDLQSLIPRRFVSVNNSSTEPDIIGNPNLKPELALGFDASYEHYFGEGGLLSLSASQRTIQDFTRSLVVLQAGRWVSLPSNEGQARTRGLEAEIKFPLKTLYASAPAVDLRASVSRNWSMVESVPGPDNRLDQQTPLSANFGIDYKAGPLTTGASFGFKNGGPVRISAQQAGYQTVRRDLDVYALWKLTPKTQLRLSLSNILNQDYVSATSYTEPTGLVTRTTTAPGYVSARALLEMKF
jgi:outer membrane receptor protein involved in Fe transport